MAMEWVYFGACIGILVTMTLAVARGLIGPSIFDRVLAVNMFGTKTVLFLAVVAYLSGRPDFLDLALTYALINFIGVIAVLLFFQSREVRRQAEQEKEAGR
jgi:multicomponent Na+:H+ antiporter subunit F